MIKIRSSVGTASLPKSLVVVDCHRIHAADIVPDVSPQLMRLNF